MNEPRTLALCAGPGGFSEAASILGVDLGELGVDISRDACATATAAGHARLNADIATLSPADFPTVTGLIVTTPCPTFSKAGKRTGNGEDYQHMLDAITALGTDMCGHVCDEGCIDFGCEHVTPHPDEHGVMQPENPAWRAVYEQVQDERTALVVQTARFALHLPSVEWVIAENVPALECAWEDLAAEMSAAGWESVNVVVLNAHDYGAGSRRERAFLYARKFTPAPGQYGTRVPAPSSAQVLGWPDGEKMRTRNNRRPTGGNLFSTDGPAWCLTGKARSCERDSDRARITPADAGALQGFPRDYPWQGSRSSQFQQIGDVVSPLVGAAILGTVLGVEWVVPVRERARMLGLGPAPGCLAEAPAGVPVQLVMEW